MCYPLARQSRRAFEPPDPLRPFPKARHPTMLSVRVSAVAPQSRAVRHSRRSRSPIRHTRASFTFMCSQGRCHSKEPRPPTFEARVVVLLLDAWIELVAASRPAPRGHCPENLKVPVQTRPGGWGGNEAPAFTMK